MTTPGRRTLDVNGRAYVLRTTPLDLYFNGERVLYVVDAVEADILVRDDVGNPLDTASAVAEAVSSAWRCELDLPRPDGTHLRVELE